MQHQAFNSSLAKAREAKDGEERIAWGERERDEAKQEAKVGQLVATAAGDAKARVEDDLTKALNALAATEEGERRSEAEIALLEAERVSLLLDLEASKGKASSLHAWVGKDKEAMEKDYQKALELIFSYGYGCCAFKHSIYGD